MLQIRNPEPLTKFSGPQPTTLSPSDLLASLASLARRRFGVFVLVFSVCVMCGAIYLYIAPPKFMAQASLLIDTRKAQLFQQQSVVGDATVDSVTVDSQIEVLKSEAIAAAVVKDLHLTSDPEFVGSKPGVLGTLLGYLSSRAPPSEVELQEQAKAVFRAGILPKRVATEPTSSILGFFRSARAARLKSRMQPRTHMLMTSLRPNTKSREGRASGCRNEFRSCSNRRRRQRKPCWISRRRTTSLTPAVA